MVEPVISLVKEVIKKQRQTLVFCGSKRSAEKQAEDIAKVLKKDADFPLKETCLALSKEFEACLDIPTEQCKRNAFCIKKGVAFHHAGLLSKQKDLIEEGFRNGTIHTICATPTLAAGVDTSAYRTIIKDIKRFTGRWGMLYIPVLEYLQMAGRAGRPGKETEGEAVLIAKSEAEKELLKEQYIYGKPENIQSKLAVEPILRSAVLSLISSKFTKTYTDVLTFFEKTFYAKQFQDMYRLEQILKKVILQLKEFGFLSNSNEETEFFHSANDIKDNETLEETPLGKRVSELYLDPLTAHTIICALKKAQEQKERNDKKHLTKEIIQALCNTIEMEPLLRVKDKEIIFLQQEIEELRETILSEIPKEHHFEYPSFLQSIKTTLFFHDYIEEASDSEILETYDVRPGEVRAKLENFDWLLRCAIELSKFLEKKGIISDLVKVQLRMKHGVKEELLSLLKLKHIGRTRARILFSKGFVHIGSFKKEHFDEVTEILGPKIAKDIFLQLGIEVVDTPLDKKKTKKNLSDYF